MGRANATHTHSTAERGATASSLSFARASAALSDRELLHIALTSKDPTESEALFNRATPLIQALALRYLCRHFSFIQGFDRDAIIQDTVVRVWDGLKGLSPERDTSAWVCTMTRFCAIDHLRTFKTLRSKLTVSLDSLGPDAENLCPPMPADHDPALLVERDDAARATRGHIDRFISKLSSADREIVQMQMEGVSYEKMGAALKVPYYVARGRLYHLRRWIKEHLDSRVND